MTKVNSIRLLALDLDGTLLNEKYELNEEVREAVIHIQAEGMIVVVATGRDKKSADPFLQALKANRYSITSGGALLWVDGSFIKQSELKATQVINILELGRKFNAGIFVDQPEQSWRLGSKNYLEKYSHVGDLTLSYQIEDLLNPLPVKITLIHENKTLLEIRRQLEDHDPKISKVFSSENILDLCPYGTDKGAALTRLSRKLGIRKNEIVSVGDSENDISMFLASKFSFAMGNAPLPVKQSASFVVPSNVENGLVLALDSIRKLRE